MKVVLKSRGIRAYAEYDIGTNNCVILAGSEVTPTISQAPTFRSKRTVEKLREKYVKNNIVTENVQFKSPSTAANFITGSSTNGFAAWKTEDGYTIGDLHKKS